MNINKTYIFRLYPNDKQKELIEKRIIKLPKLKEIKVRGYRNLKDIKGRIINATIYKEDDKYYVSICVEEDKNISNVIPSSIVGIDLGIKDLVITSSQEKYQNNKYIKKYEKKIAGLNKWLSRSKPGSKNRYKIIKKLQTVYKK